MSKDETLTYIDRAIEQFQIQAHYDEAVNAVRPLPGIGFAVETSQARYETRRCDSNRDIRQTQQTCLPDSLGEEAAIFSDALSVPLEGWKIIEASSLVQMVHRGHQKSTVEIQVEELNATDFSQMMALAELTKP